MEPNIHQPDSMDASKASEGASSAIFTSNRLSDIAADASQFDRDWQYAQKALTARWNALTPDDFVAADGYRERFVECLASRSGISQFEASNDLAAFEAHQPIHWRRAVPSRRSKPKLT